MLRAAAATRERCCRRQLRLHLHAGSGHISDLVGQRLHTVGIDAEVAAPANASPLSFSRMRL